MTAFKDAFEQKRAARAKSYRKLDGEISHGMTRVRTWPALRDSLTRTAFPRLDRLTEEKVAKTDRSLSLHAGRKASRRYKKGMKRILRFNYPKSLRREARGQRLNWLWLGFLRILWFPIDLIRKIPPRLLFRLVLFAALVYLLWQLLSWLIPGWGGASQTPTPETPTPDKGI